MILADPFSYYLPTSSKLQYIFQSANLHPIGIPQEPIVELVAFDRLLELVRFCWMPFSDRLLEVSFLIIIRLKII